MRLYPGEFKKPTYRSVAVDSDVMLIEDAYDDAHEHSMVTDEECPHEVVQKVRQFSHNSSVDLLRRSEAALDVYGQDAGISLTRRSQRLIPEGA